MLQVDPTLDQASVANILGKADAMQSGMGKGRLNLSDAIQTVSDTTAPTVTLLRPTSGGVLFGSTLLAASASDNVSVAGVRFLLDALPLGAETPAPYEQMWTTKSTTSASTTVSNDTAAPTVMMRVRLRATVSGTVLVAATA